jgi:hypothetical protein
VKHTHRIHVAIETGPEVEFHVGPTEDEMTKVQILLNAINLLTITYA